ncbi:MAG: hypothetical protein ABI944_06430, partial [Chthoniobacterales bacterium]
GAIATTRRDRLGWLAAALVVELISVTWVCSLYHVFFQPLPSVLAVGVSLAAAFAFLDLARRWAARTPAKVFADRVSDEQIAKISSAETPVKLAPRASEVTAVVVDLAYKHDLADEYEPAVFAALTERFIAHATDTFLKAGAYIESAAGEGVVAIFGFPVENPQHAEQATREAMGLVGSIVDLPESARENGATSVGIHAGVSSGRMIIAPLSADGAVLTTGEPVELARRFCIANRFYGSRVLIGPRTFELASKTLVARPIDFLSGVDVRQRHEIYEPISLIVDASPDELNRRDAFWNGVVLYREKRWAEAYAQFQQARRPDDADDAPLQLYLRRLEPLALHLTSSPLDE